MILLASTSDLIRVVTSSTADLHVHATFADLSSGAATWGRQNTAITSATTTTVVSSPASSTFRSVKTLTARNAHATTSQDVTVTHTDGTNVAQLVKVTLLAGWALHYDEGRGFTTIDEQGRKVERIDLLLPAVSPLITAVVLGTDVTNNNASANTIADITGLSFDVVADATYKFRFVIVFTAAATTTGSRWSINGPSSPTTLHFRSDWSISTSARNLNEGLTAYDQPSAASGTSAATAGNIAVIEGLITPSADGTVIGRFASEVSSSAIVAKAGSVLHWQRIA